MFLVGGRRRGLDWVGGRGGGEIVFSEIITHWCL